MKRKMFLYFSPVLLAATLLIIPFANVSELMSGSQSGKSFYFAFAVMGLVITVISSKLISANYAIRIKPLDAVIGLYFCYSVLHPLLFDYSIPSIIWVESISLALFYLIVRQVSGRYLIILIIGISLAGMAQAIYGNLQLWGYYPSNHGIFRMTGSFFNPGPYAGFLCAVLPVAVGLYFGRVKHVSFVSFVERVSFVSIVKRVMNAMKMPNNRNISNSEASNPSNSFLVSIVKKVSLVWNALNYRNVDNNRNNSNGEAADPSNFQTFFLQNISGLIAIPTIIMIVLVLPASRSRAAWLGALTGCFLVLQTLQPFQLFKRQSHKLFQHYKQVLIVAGILLSALALVGMYKFKQDSADGRLLIWKVAGNMVAEKPVWGHGTGKFAADYMNYQAAYFKPNPDIPEAMNADNVTYPYNELLKMTVENGVIGLLLGLGVIGCLFFVKIDYEIFIDNLSLLAARGGLLSILVFALFSYPSEILPIKMLFVLFASVVATHQNPLHIFQLPAKETTLMPKRKAAFAGKAVWYAAFAIVLITIYPAGKYISRQYQAYKLWKDASDVYNVGAYPESLENFELAYPQLINNGVFLVQYGKALEMAKKYVSSIVILNEAKQHLNNTILYTCLGNNYKALGQKTDAEQAYLQAFNMGPARFYPLYLLAKLYYETGQQVKAVQLANELLEKEVKIESTAVEEIKEEMKKIIEKQYNTQDMFNHKGKGRKHNYQVATASCPAPFLKKKVR